MSHGVNFLAYVPFQSSVEAQILAGAAGASQKARDAMEKIGNEMESKG